MSDAMFNIGVEEEFQIVDPETGELQAHISEMLPRGREMLGEQIKPEMLQSMVEVTTHVCANISEVRAEIVRLRSTIADLAAASAACASSPPGTHPFSHWQTPADHR